MVFWALLLCGPNWQTPWIAPQRGREVLHTIPRQSFHHLLEEGTGNSPKICLNANAAHGEKAIFISVPLHHLSFKLKTRLSDHVHCLPFVISTCQSSSLVNQTSDTVQFDPGLVDVGGAQTHSMGLFSTLKGDKE